MKRYDTTEKFKKTDTDQLNLAHVARKKQKDINSLDNEIQFKKNNLF